MSPPATRLTLMILVDALRPDYVNRMPYLRALADESATGFLRECFGFVPRAAYFGGLTAEQLGFTNMFCFDPQRSPFSMARAMPSSPAGAEAERRLGIRQRIESAARNRVPAFAKDYTSTAEIPLPFAPYFDLVEKRGPWDPHVGYRSLFHALDAQGIPWLECSWPGTNRLPDPSDDGIVLKVLADLKPEHQFCYVHLQELDGSGHALGPNASAMQQRLAATDRRCRQLIESVRTRYQQLNLVLFGDHGMVSVTRTLDLWEVLQGLGLVFGVDYACFLDSSMARFWFYHGRARHAIERALTNLPGGRLLLPRDLEAFGIAGCDPRNAQLIFLADPGVLIFPNFFQARGEPIKGMHGYDPDCPDNLGFFLLHASHQPELRGGQLGKIDPPQLFHLLADLLQLHSTTRRPPLKPSPAPSAVGRFTAHPDPAADLFIHRQLEQVVSAVYEAIDAVESIVLTGSFGRGEGGVYQDAQGAYHPVNDYDLLVVSPQNQAEPLRKLGRDLAGRLGLDYVDLGWSDGQWAALPLSVSHYDLKYGSQVLAGDPDILHRIPAYGSADLPLYEAVKLLLNRSAGLLTGLNAQWLEGQAPLPDQSRYMSNQIAKAWMALGDWHLIRWGGYDASYRLRRDRFACLAPGAGLDSGTVRNIARAYDFKVQPDYLLYADGAGEVRRLYPCLEMALIQAINLMTGRRATQLNQAMDAYVEFMSSDLETRRLENALCLAHPGFQPLLRSSSAVDCSLRHLIYAVVPLVLTAMGHPERGEADCRAALLRLDTALRAPQLNGFNPQSWDKVRAFVVSAWFNVCH